MSERYRESEPTKQFIRKSMAEILVDLASNPNVSGAEVEYEVDGTVSAEQLQNLLDLPYEVAITEKDGKPILTPLTFRGNDENPEYMDRQIQSRLWAHTHNKSDDGILVDTPSLQDILVSTVVKESTSMLVAHTRGITHFGKIKRHPVTGAELSSKQSTSALFTDYQDHIGAALSKRYETSEQPFILDKYTDEECVELAKKFIRTSGMFLAEAEWQDQDAVDKLLKVINLED